MKRKLYIILEKFAYSMQSTKKRALEKLEERSLNEKLSETLAIYNFCKICIFLHYSKLRFQENTNVAHNFLTTSSEKFKFMCNRIDNLL